MDKPTFTHHGLRVFIEPEEDAGNPYLEQDMLSDVVTWMRSYDFDSTKSKPYSDPQEVVEAFERGELAFYAPLYAYIHSGITVSMGEMDWRWPDKEWDCGLAGMVYVTMEKAKAEFPKLFDKNGRPRNKAKLAEECQRAAKGEVKTLDQWLTGDVWWYNIEDEEGTSLDSCGWLYGYEYAEQEAREQAEYWAKRREKERVEMLKEWREFGLGEERWEGWSGSEEPRQGLSSFI